MIQNRERLKTWILERMQTYFLTVALEAPVAPSAELVLERVTNVWA